LWKNGFKWGFLEINKARNKKLKTKKVFKKAKDDIEAAQEEKGKGDHLFEKKKKFYEEVYRKKLGFYGKKRVFSCFRVKNMKKMKKKMMNRKMGQMK